MTHNERNDPISREGTVSTITDRALCFFDDVSEREVWIPHQYIKSWVFTDMGTDRGWPLGALETGDDITVVIPRWLAVKERIVNE